MYSDADGKHPGSTFLGHRSLDLLPHDIVERIGRVQDFHTATRYTHESLSARPPADAANRPSPYRLFTDAPKVALPTVLLDATAPALAVLADGRDAVPDSQLNPPQDLKTLATWLYLAAGETGRREIEGRKFSVRAVPSIDALYPCEIYVAAFAIEGLEAGLYHFSVLEFALRKLRGGAETLAQIKRGRPELAFLKNVPAALLVSTIFWRSAWNFRQRGYRIALIDCGHLVQNLVCAGTALGMTIQPRLWMNDRTTRDLIGVSIEADFESAEAVQALVIWSDTAEKPMAGDRNVTSGPLPLIERKPLSPACTAYGSITATHLDCVAPGMPLREVRPPLTSTSAMPDEELGVEFPTPPLDPSGQRMRQVLQMRRSYFDFEPRAISREKLLTINRLAFMTGTFPPILPDGPHIGLIRPFWIVHDVPGIESGLWLFHPSADRWWLLRRGTFRAESRWLAADNPAAGNAAAVCYFLANLGYLMSNGGPDVYRLAHLEAGVAGERMALAASALGLGTLGLGAFFEEDVRRFFQVDKTRWEPIFAVAVGAVPAETR
jgi:SagB-type dehydrogenase family enzyme